MKKYLFVLVLLTTSAYAQEPGAVEKVVDQRLRAQMGDLMVNNVILATRVDVLVARVAELEKQLAEAKKNADNH